VLHEPVTPRDAESKVGPTRGERRMLTMRVGSNIEWHFGGPLTTALSLITITMANSLFPTDLPLHILAIWAQICPESKLEDVRTSGTSARMKRYCFCDSSVKLGAGSADNSLIQHIVSKKCRNAQPAHESPLPPVESTAASP
jgi:hypothetical protein